MKKLLHLSIFTLIITIFYGCPVGIDYPLGKPGDHKIDKDMIGTWVAGSDEADVKKVEFSKNDDHSYKVHVLERGEMYALETDNLTGWLTEVDGKTFLYLKPDDEEKYYHYMIKESGKGTLVTCDVSLLDGGVDSVTSSETLRKQVSSSMNMEGYCAETLNWTKQ